MTVLKSSGNIGIDNKIHFTVSEWNMFTEFLSRFGESTLTVDSQIFISNDVEGYTGKSTCNVNITNADISSVGLDVDLM